MNELSDSGSDRQDGRWNRGVIVGLAVVVLLAAAFFVGRLPAFRPYNVEPGALVAQIDEPAHFAGDGALHLIVCPQRPEGSFGLAGYLVVWISSQTSVADQRLGVRLPTNPIMLRPGQQVLIRPGIEAAGSPYLNLLPAQEIVILASDRLPIVPHCVNPSLAP